MRRTKKRRRLIRSAKWTHGGEKSVLWMRSMSSLEQKAEAPSNGPASDKSSALYRSIKLRLLNAAISPYYHME